MNSLLNNNDYVAIVANSNGIDVNNKEKIDNLIKLLKNIALNRHLERADLIKPPCPYHRVRLGDNVKSFPFAVIKSVATYQYLHPQKTFTVACNYAYSRMVAF